MLDADFLQRNLGFDADWGLVRAVVSEMPKDPTILTSFYDFSPPFIIPPLFHTQQHSRRRYAVALTVQHIITSWSLNWWGGGSFVACHWKGHRKEKPFINNRPCCRVASHTSNLSIVLRGIVDSYSTLPLVTWKRVTIVEVIPWWGLLRHTLANGALVYPKQGGTYRADGCMALG